PGPGQHYKEWISVVERLLRKVDRSISVSDSRGRRRQHRRLNVFARAARFQFAKHGVRFLPFVPRRINCRERHHCPTVTSGTDEGALGSGGSLFILAVTLQRYG